MLAARNYIASFICLAIYCCCFSGCAKEYSFEGGRVPVRTDTIVTPPPVVPAPYFCASCTGRDLYEENRWSFYDNNIFFCGIIDTAIVAPLRSGFTFYGPSACTTDSGAVYTVTFENGERLDRDLVNITTRRGAFYYYDNPRLAYIYMNVSNTPFNFTIEEYNHQTKMARGYFSGMVRKENGGGTLISSGKFKVRLL